jgi:protein TonB
VRESRGSFRRALEVSLLLHLLLVFLILPRVHEVWPSTESGALRLLPEPATVDQAPLRFELVELAEDREESQSDERAPLSDLDRRAHGGEGEAAARPASQGNTPQLVQSDGGVQPQPLRPPTQPQQVPPPQPEEPEPEEPERPEETTEPEGAGDETQQPATQQPVIRLPKPTDFTLPPDRAGMPENPNRRGGQVDLGGLSFDTQWYDWGPYAKRMLAKIKRNWYIRMPEIAMLGAKGVVKIRFFIERDGTMTGLVIMDESGRPPMDFAARDAIRFSSPFEPLPPDLTGVDREGVTITFYYNIHPPDWGGH